MLIHPDGIALMGLTYLSKRASTFMRVSSLINGDRLKITTHVKGADRGVTWTVSLSPVFHS